MKSARTLIAASLGLVLALGMLVLVGLAQPGNPDPEPDPNTHTAPPTTTVSITYDEPINPSTVTSHTFAVYGMQSGLVTAVHGVISGGYTIVVTPTNAFFSGELVQASATTATLNITGTAPVSPTVWRFRTATAGGSAIFMSGNPFGLYNGSAEAIALGDMDGDGDLDVAVGNEYQQNRVYLNNGDGTFTPIGNDFGPSDDRTRTLALGDVDGDGDLDIAVGNGGQQNRVYLNNGDGTFTTSTTFGTGTDSTRALALGDLDGDGDLDLAVGNGGQQNQVYLNNGDGTFTPTGNTFGPSGDRTRALALGDVDGDGDLDVAVGNYNQQNRVYLNNGDGTFAPTGNDFGPANDYTYALALGDVDGDGDLDVAVGNYNQQNRVYLNNGDGTFAPTGNNFGPANDYTCALALGDMDGDGDLDVAVGNYNRQNRVYLNNGNGTFAPTGNNFGPASDDTYALALGDADGDGDLDVAVGNYYGQDTLYRNRHLADLWIAKSAMPLVIRPGATITYTLVFSNAGVLTATNVVITDAVPAALTNLQVTSSGATITDTGATPAYVWTVEDLSPGEGGVITITGQAYSAQPCAVLVNTAIITSANPDEVPDNNSDTDISSINGSLHITSLDPGVSLTVNGTPAPAGSDFCFTPGDTVVLSTTFGGQTYEDVIEAHYYLDISVHAKTYVTSPGTVYLDTDLGYTPYDIFVVTSTDTDEFTFDMATPPTDDAVRIIGLHALVPTATISALGDSSHTGPLEELAEVFYGTVENEGELYIETTCDDEVGSAFNKIVGHEVYFYTWCSDDVDIMIQELQADYAESDDTEISWWRMELTGQFYVDDYDGYSLNDELPELASLQDDPLLWFKARNPDKWSLYPLIDIQGQGYTNAWEFDNYDYEDYNFWEMHLGGDFYWYNDDDYYEYAHFLGPVMEMDRFTWTPDDYLYLNFFGDNNDNYYDTDRFDGDYGSAGADFWEPLLTSSYGYSDTNGNIVSPIFVFRLREGYFEAGYYDTYLYLADGQDLLILSDSDELEFYDAGSGIYFNQGTDAHWVVEDRLTYSGTVPTDDAFNITVTHFITNGLTAVVTATNNYAGTGNDTVSTMYLAYRRTDAYGQQFTKAPMTYDSGSGAWSVTTTVPQSGEYDFYIVATENDDAYGKVVERHVRLEAIVYMPMVMRRYP